MFSFNLSFASPSFVSLFCFMFVYIYILYIYIYIYIWLSLISFLSLTCRRALWCAACRSDPQAHVSEPRSLSQRAVLKRKSDFASFSFLLRESQHVLAALRRDSQCSARSQPCFNCKLQNAGFGQQPVRKFYPFDSWRMCFHCWSHSFCTCFKLAEVSVKTSYRCSRLE